MKKILILCSVIDNYGDIGFVYRLSRSISQTERNADLTLVVSNLESFASMAPQVDPCLPYQEVNGWKILDWNNAQECTRRFLENPPDVVLQCFQCLRPDWLDNLLFDKNRTEKIHLINVEYLTAEEWADDFHLLKSATRSSLVKKVNFMPGFTPKTGGLVLDEPFMSFRKNHSEALECLRNHVDESAFRFLSERVAGRETKKAVLIFSYQRDFEPLARVFAGKEVRIFLAPGLSRKPFLDAAMKVDPDMEISLLPYLPQNAWDALLNLTDISFVRGEDSFSRSCLAGIPFLWHVYRQDGEFQVAKLEAFLCRIKPFMETEDFAALRDFSICYNLPLEKEVGQWMPDDQVREILKRDSHGKKCTVLHWTVQLMEESLEKIWAGQERMKKAFEKFGDFLVSNGNLAVHLMDCIETLKSCLK